MDVVHRLRDGILHQGLNSEPAVLPSSCVQCVPLLPHQPCPESTGWLLLLHTTCRANHHSSGREERTTYVDCRGVQLPPASPREQVGVEARLDLEEGLEPAQRGRRLPTHRLPADQRLQPHQTLQRAQRTTSLRPTPVFFPSALRCTRLQATRNRGPVNVTR
jgi:hypothetical protein